MKRRLILIGTALAALATAAPQALHAQPIEGPLRIVVGYAPGGSSDRVARIVGDKLQAKLGIPVVVENKTGAGGRLAAQQVKATPAGQSVLMLANPAVMVVAPLVFKDNGYDAERDFTPVSQVNDYEFGSRGGHGRAGARALPPAGLAAQQPGESQFRRARHRQPAALLRVQLD
jgi:tripartite-type tricarboxylate transporter receptor subunit TctC